MRKPSYASIVERLDSVERTSDARAIILRCIFNGEGMDAQQVAVHDGARYTFNLYSALGANGGVVAVLFDSPHNGAISVDCMRLDDLHYPMLSEYLPLNIAVERLKSARHDLCSAERAA